MLSAMDIPGAAATGTAAVPWLVVGVVLGVGLVILVGLGTALVLRWRSGPAQDDPGGDDLPGFLESPPGSATPAASAGWAALAAPPVHPEPVRRPGRDARVPAIAMAVTALLLSGAAAAVAATTSRPDGRPAHTPASAAPTTTSGAAARLTFGGVVLEPRAVGVTATYPVVQVSGEDDATVARVEFPTFNCLTGDAPADPVAAGCARAGTEYAELRSPDLVVRTHGDVLQLAGRFPTELHPNGSAPSATGRSYELRITVTPVVGTARDGWRPARGTLELGPGRATTVDQPGLNVLRSGS
jgi:hypothetical protein